ncbi:unnamed protein product, partial [marine sediment metagenome]
MRTDVARTPVERQEPLRDFAGMRVHLVGIGGSGMRGAADVLLELGARVSGSDLVPFDGLGTLVARGARVAIGHRE